MLKSEGIKFRDFMDHMDHVDRDGISGEPTSGMLQERLLAGYFSPVPKNRNGQFNESWRSKFGVDPGYAKRDE